MERIFKGHKLRYVGVESFQMLTGWSIVVSTIAQGFSKSQITKAYISLWLLFLKVYLRMRWQQPLMLLISERRSADYARLIAPPYFSIFASFFSQKRFQLCT